MTLQQFINKYNGKKVDWDGKFGAQCVDLYRFYLKEVWEVPQTPPVKGAYQILDTLPKGFQKFINGLPQAGDVVTWNEQFGEFGHVAIIVSANAKGIKVFEQNNPVGGACRIGDHTYKNVMGWFRPIKSLNDGTMFRTYQKTIYLLVAGYWLAVATSYEQFLVDFGGVTAPEMTEQQFKAYPVTRPTIK